MIFGLLASSYCVYICVILEREFLHCLLKASHESRPLASTKNIGKELATIDDNQQNNNEKEKFMCSKMRTYLVRNGKLKKRKKIMT